MAHPDHRATAGQAEADCVAFVAEEAIERESTRPKVLNVSAQ
jgi:hypothetical protein